MCIKQSKFGTKCEIAVERTRIAKTLVVTCEHNHQTKWQL